MAGVYVYGLLIFGCQKWTETAKRFLVWDYMELIDDTGHFVAGVPWDPAVSQKNEKAHTYQSIYFVLFGKVKVKTNCAPISRSCQNPGSWSLPGQWPTGFKC